MDLYTEYYIVTAVLHPHLVGMRAIGLNLTEKDLRSMGRKEWWGHSDVARGWMTLCRPHLPGPDRLPPPHRSQLERDAVRQFPRYPIPHFLPRTPSRSPWEGG